MGRRGARGEPTRWPAGAQGGAQGASRCKSRYGPPRLADVAMKLPVTPEFLAQASQFRLRHQCQDCVLYDADRPVRDRCAHGYPTDEHTRALEQLELVFCKDFEAL